MVAEVSALVAAVSGNRPTVLTVVNIGLLLLLGAAVPAAASRCPPWVVALGAVPIAVCAVLGTDPPVLGPAAAVAGAAVALGVLVAGLRAPVVRSVAGALAVQGALRLPWPDAVGASALVAGLSLTPILLVGWFRASRRGRVVSASVCGAVATVMAVGLGCAVMLGLSVQDDARAGVKATQRAVDALVDGDRELAATELATARSLLTGVDGTTHSWWTTPAMAVPLVSQHVELARDLITYANQALSAAQEANDKADPKALRLDGASVDLDKVASFEGPLERASQALRQLDLAIDEASDGVWIVKPLKDELVDLSDDVIRARRDVGNALEIVQMAPGLLGGQGDRRYFLALMTPAELRGTIGIVGSYGTVTASNGSISLEQIGRNSDLNEAGLSAERVLNAPEDYVARYASFDPQGTWQNVPLSPDWPTNAAVMADLYPQSGGRPVDGVIGMDPVALTGFLQITGPITVPSWPEPITAENARQILLFDQYGAFGERTDRVSFLGEVASVLWAKLLETSPDPIALADALGPVAREGHLMMWAKDPEEQGLFRQLGVSGQLAPLVGDDVFAVTGINTGGDKLDLFLERTIDYAVDWNPEEGILDAEATVTLHNSAPATGLPGYVTGLSDGSLGVEAQNRDWTTIYSPLELVDATLDGELVGPDIKTELGRNAISQYLRLDPGATSVLSVRLTGQIVGKQYRVAVTRQVMVQPERFTITVNVPSGWSISTSEDNVTPTGQSTTVSVTLGPERDHLVVFNAQDLARDG